jgi:hypothetical protein
MIHNCRTIALTAGAGVWIGASVVCAQSPQTVNFHPTTLQIKG